MRTSWRPSRQLVLIAALVGGALFTLVAPTAWAGSPGLSLRTAVNGQPSITSSDARPAQLYPTSQADITVTLANNSSEVLRVSTVRFQGTVLDLPLFSYDTSVDLAVPPGKTRSLAFPVVLTGIGSQATGLVNATISLLQPNGVLLASQAVVTNIHGSLTSIYGLFGLVVLLLTLSSLFFGLLGLARHTLSQNRWARGVRFAIPGFGIGLVLTFTLSAFRVFVPTAGHWLPLLIVPTIAGLSLGFLTPAPNEEEFDDYDDDVLLAQIVVVDDDPLEAVGERSDGQLVGVGAAEGPATRGPRSSLPDGRPTGAPATGSTGSPQPEGRATTRPTAPPDTRPTAPPDTRPTAPPQ